MDRHTRFRVGNITSRWGWMVEYNQLVGERDVKFKTGDELKSALSLWFESGMSEDAIQIKEALEILTEISDDLQNPVVKASARALLEEVWG